MWIQDLNKQIGNACTRKERRRGISLIEAIGAMLILAFITLATVNLYRVGDKQQRTARNYANAQTANREAVRRMVRTLRHAYGVKTGVAASTFGGTGAALNSDTSSRIIVTVPQPNASGQDYVQFYLSGGTLYGQNGTSAAIAIATGVQTLALTYYQTTNASTGATTATLNSGYTAATEVGITLVTLSGGSTAGVTSTENAYVELRNASLGF